MNQIETSSRERKKDETRERITRAALELFAEKGYDATTVDEISIRADVAKGTFFNYYPRKEAVLTTLAEHEIESLEAWVEQSLAGPGPVIAKLHAMFDFASDSYEHEPQLRRRMLVELQKGEGQPLEAIHTRGQAAVRRLVEAGQASGELRRDADPERVTWVLRGTYIGTMMQWLFRGEPLDVRGELRARLALILEGLGSREGR